MNTKLQGFFFRPPFADNYWAHILEEVYRSNVYAPFIEGKNLKTCVEIGGNVGLVSYYFSQHFEKVFVLEPAQQHFETLSFQLEFNKLTNVFPFKVALSNKDGEAEFYHNQNQTMYSLSAAVADQTLQPEKVKTVQLDTFLRDQEIDHVDLLKLDCEGEEGNIVCHSSFQNAASKIDVVVCEIHNWMGRNRQQLIDGFKYAGFTNVKQIPNNADIIVAQKV